MDQTRTLDNFFASIPRLGLAFSGGVDSAYLLYAAVEYYKKVAGNQAAQEKHEAGETGVIAYYVKSSFQPEFEYKDAQHMAAALGVSLRVLELDVLSCPEVRSNPANRCYYCKKEIFRHILEAAAADGCTVVADGTNASDDVTDRPGMKALQELGVRSPLRECGLDKAQIRSLSEKAGLFTWKKPAYACLATRIPTGQEITEQMLEITERAEAFLFDLGLENFRVRMMDDCARIQLPESQLIAFMEHRETIHRELGQYYRAVLLDLEVRDEQ